MFLKLFERSTESKTTVLVAVAAIRRILCPVSIGSAAIGIFTEWHTATLAKFMIFHINLIFLFSLLYKLSLSVSLNYSYVIQLPTKYLSVTIR